MSVSSVFGKAGSKGAFIKDASQREQFAKSVSSATGNKLTVYAASACALPDGAVLAAREGQARKLVVAGAANGFNGTKAGEAVRGPR
jgi:hypothetical protein